MKIYLCNAFSLSMLDRDQQRRRVEDHPRIPRPVGEIALKEYMDRVRDGKIEMISAVGHKDTAALFSGILGIEVQVNRMSVKLTDINEERALIGQLIGPRLPEGCTTLPEGASIEWWVV